MMQKTDVVVIGAGPVGLFSIFECGMLKLKCHVFDALDILGGQCAALYPEKPIYDIPAYPKVQGKELVDNLLKQAEPFAPHYHTSEQVCAIEQLDSQGRQWLVKGTQGSEVMCSSIIIAAGVGAFGPNKPPLENLETYESTGCVQYYVKSREDFRGKKVVIAGGGDSAVDWAISLSELAQKVYVVHRRAKFRCAPESADQLAQLAKDNKIELVVPYQLQGLEGHEGQLTHVKVNTLDGQSKALEADVLLPFFGLSMNLGPIAEWDLGITKKHIDISNPTTMATNRPGIYAIGDVATYDNKLKLILTGFAEAAQAAHAIRKFLYPDEVLHFEYSTTKGVP